jgi:hypothetical protein
MKIAKQRGMARARVAVALIQVEVLAYELTHLARLIEACQSDAYELPNRLGDLGLAVSFTVLSAGRIS